MEVKVIFFFLGWISASQYLLESTYIGGIFHEVGSTAALVDSFRVDTGIDGDFGRVHQVTEVGVIWKRNEERLIINFGGKCCLPIKYVA